MIPTILTISMTPIPSCTTYIWLLFCKMGIVAQQTIIFMVSRPLNGRNVNLACLKWIVQLYISIICTRDWCEFLNTKDVEFRERRQSTSRTTRHAPRPSTLACSMARWQLIWFGQFIKELSSMSFSILFPCKLRQYPWLVILAFCHIK